MDVHSIVFNPWSKDQYDGMSRWVTSLHTQEQGQQSAGRSMGDALSRAAGIEGK